MPPLQIPSVELAAVLMLVQDAGNLNCLLPKVREDSDPHIDVVWGMLSLHASGGGGALLACHVDISNCFWSLVLPPQYRHSFRIRVDDMVYACKALPFGWVYSPVICQEVLTSIVRKGHVRDVIVLIYYDDILVIGFGASRLQPAANAIVDILVSEGALVSPKSKMIPLDCIDWIGKQFRFGEGVITGSTNKWSALPARWLLFSVGHCF